MGSCIMKIIKALPEDAETLSRVALASKAHWGYPPDWLEKWKDDLVVTPHFIKQHDVYKLVPDNGGIIGFCALSARDAILWIEHLWLLPACMGRGLGRMLHDHAMAQVRARGYRECRVIADPNAVPFYMKMGMSVIDRVESWPAGRYLPVLARQL